MGVRYLNETAVTRSAKVDGLPVLQAGKDAYPPAGLLIGAAPIDVTRQATSASEVSWCPPPHEGLVVGRPWSCACLPEGGSD